MYSDIKLPDAQSTVLHALYEIKDALTRNDYNAAFLHCTDSIACVQNELDWCYRSDPILPFIREFLLELQGMLDVIEENRQHIPAVIEILLSTTNEVTQAASNISAWNEPDKHLDLLEIEHRRQLYNKG